jgi:hypothetical protein
MAQNGNGSNTGNNTGGGGEGSPAAFNTGGGGEGSPAALFDFEQAALYPTQGTQEWERPTQTVAPELYNEEDYIVTWDLSNGILEASDSISTLYVDFGGASSKYKSWPTNVTEASQLWTAYSEQEFHPPMLTRATVQAMTLTTDGTTSYFHPHADPELPDPHIKVEKTLWYTSDLAAPADSGFGASSLAFSGSVSKYGSTSVIATYRSLGEAQQLASVCGYVRHPRSLTTIISAHITDIINAGFPIVPDVGNQIVNTVIKYGSLKDKS